MLIASCLCLLFNLKVEVVRSSETSVNYLTTWHHIPDKSSAHSNGYENLKSNITK